MAKLIGFCRSRLICQLVRVVIIRFPSVSEAPKQQLWSALISCRAKKAAFEQAGFRVECIELPETEDLPRFEDLLIRLEKNEETAGLIIQRPIPSKFQHLVSSRTSVRDLDSCSIALPVGNGSAAAEASVRLITHYSGSINPVAVIGGRGYVGSSIVRKLHDLRIPYQIIEREDHLDKPLTTPVIVSATGRPHLLNCQHLFAPQRLLIDVGFTPISLNPLIIRGDIDPAAYPSNSIVTPVPGGVGPLQISVLLERAARFVGIKGWPEWSLTLS